MTHHHHPSRRNFLKGAGGFATATGLAASPFINALAATSGSTSDYKALVCIFLQGGNDSHNTVLATDTASWNAYMAARNIGSSPIALQSAGMTASSTAAVNSTVRVGGVLPITPSTVQSGRTFALHPLLSNLQGLFNNGKMSIVANVGTLSQPTTVQSYLAGTASLPPKLFSHNDQQSVWQSSSPEGAQGGWGGELVELMASSNGANVGLSAISASGQAVWLNGRSLVPYQVGLDGAVRIIDTSSPLYNSSQAWNILRNVISTPRTATFQKDYASLTQRSLDRSDQLRSALPAVGAGGVLAATNYNDPIHGGTAVNPLAQQLQVVARMIAARSALGLKRQVFFVTLPGFDTHSDQNAVHADLMAKLDHGISYFQNALAALPGGDATGMVTTFTASDFGRSFISNGDGTDHGWGGHQFVVGGAVNGGNVFGRFPSLVAGSSDDIGNGRLLPSIAVEQYSATLASWFGASDSQLDSILPHLKNFGTRNLGFMS